MKTQIQNLFKTGRASLPLLVALAIFGLIQPVRAQFSYTVQNGTITITGYNPAAGLNVIIPATINGTNVTSIGYEAFFLGSSLTSVTIPNRLTSIGDYAFQNCTLMASVSIGNGVNYLGSDAFYNCTSLTNVTIPNSVTNLGTAAFYNCSRVTSVTIGNGVHNIGTNVFNGCTSLTNVTIPNSVTSIGTNAFASCHSLTSVTIGHGVTSIGIYVFYDCYGLTNVTIPNSVTSIGDDAFSGCTSLTNVTIPNSVTSIGQEAFAACGFTSVTIPNSVTSLLESAFYDCIRLTSVYFGGNAPGPVYSAFYYDPAIVYYLPGTIGWDTTFDGASTALWTLPYPLILTGNSGFGAQANGFSFTVSWATNSSVVIEACTNLSSPVWQPLQTNALVNGTNYFTDGNWTDYPRRFYRARQQ